MNHKPIWMHWSQCPQLIQWSSCGQNTDISQRLILQLRAGKVHHAKPGKDAQIEQNSPLTVSITPHVMRPDSFGAVNMAANNSAPVQLSSGYRTCPWEMDCMLYWVQRACECVRVCACVCVITFTSLSTKPFLCPWRIQAQWCPYLLGNNCNTWKSWNRSPITTAIKSWVAGNREQGVLTKCSRSSWWGRRASSHHTDSCGARRMLEMSQRVTEVEGKGLNAATKLAFPQ